MIRSEATGLVDATADTVWDVLTDASNYEAWDSGVTRLAGRVRDGSSITVRARRGRTMRIRVRMVPWTIRWEHRGPLGVFKAARTCTLLRADGQTLLNVTEEFNGPRMLRKLTALSAAAPALEAFVRGAKSRAELLGRTRHHKHVSDASGHVSKTDALQGPEVRRIATSDAPRQQAGSLRFGP